MRAKSDTKATDNKKSNSLFWATGVLLALTLGLSVYFNFKGYFDPQVVATLPINNSCDLHSEVCNLNLPQGGTVSLSIEPRT
ncbi:MAG: hypothetical protein DSZ28_04440, partial [Thiothrix sp.]